MSCRYPPKHRKHFLEFLHQKTGGDDRGLSPSLLAAGLSQPSRSSSNDSAAAAGGGKGGGEGLSEDVCEAFSIWLMDAKGVGIEAGQLTAQMVCIHVGRFGVIYL